MGVIKKLHFHSIVLITLFLIISNYSYATSIVNKSVSENKFRNWLMLGEREYPDSVLTSKSLANINKYTGKLEFLDAIFLEKYFDNFFDPSVFELSNFWVDEFSLEAGCPDGIFNENIEYFRYLYRLVVISYLVENIKNNHLLLYSLRLDSNKCDIEWDKIFSRCSPQYIEMQKFLQRGKIAHLKSFDKSYYKRFTKMENEVFIQKLVSNKTEIVFDNVFDYLIPILNSECKKNQMFCGNLNNLENAISKICSQGKQQIERICNERDKLFGLSYTERPTFLIAFSDAVNAINAGSYAQNCLYRFHSAFRDIEEKNLFVKDIFEANYKILNEKNERYLQGELFLSGALKKFDDLGVPDFLFVSPKVAIEVKQEEIVKEIPKEAAAVVVKKITPEVKINSSTQSMVQIEKKESAFLIAWNSLYSAATDLKEKFVDMQKFEIDFPITGELRDRLEGPLSAYQTREAILEMKMYDEFGSKKAPISLVFLKYLIDVRLHQSLYNLVSIVGNQFYVDNDIDKQKVPCLVELKNDKQTNYKWQIVIKKE